jgi:hypothetical protein
MSHFIEPTSIQITRRQLSIIQLQQSPIQAPLPPGAKPVLQAALQLQWPHGRHVEVRQLRVGVLS